MPGAVIRDVNVDKIHRMMILTVYVLGDERRQVNKFTCLLHI